VENPDKAEVSKGRRTVYDTWMERSPSPVDSGRPHVAVLGSGSDYAAFVCRLGVSSADIRFTFDASLNMSSYPLYHSAYETSYYYETYIDPGFNVSQCDPRFVKPKHHCFDLLRRRSRGTSA